MKGILTPIALLILLSTVSCTKNTDTSGLQFADKPYTLYDFRAPGDTTITEVNDPSTLTLYNDGTWTIEISGALSKGTYEWSPASNGKGEIKFKILDWAGFPPNQMLSEKLQSALQSVTHYGYIVENPSFVTFWLDNYQSNYFPFLRTSRK